MILSVDLKKVNVRPVVSRHASTTLTDFVPAPDMT
jgi:hypothetical protein